MNRLLPLSNNETKAKCLLSLNPDFIIDVSLCNANGFKDLMSP